GTVACPPHRLAELNALLRASSPHAHHTVRFILSLVGKLSFAAHVLPGARHFFRSLIDATRGLRKNAAFRLDQLLRALYSVATEHNLLLYASHIASPVTRYPVT